jgi:hypothetical protein
MIEYVPGAEPAAETVGEVEFVGGPRHQEREVRVERPVVIAAGRGLYRRGVSCADDGMLRYIWVPTASATR